MKLLELSDGFVLAIDTEGTQGTFELIFNLDGTADAAKEWEKGVLVSAYGGTIEALDEFRSIMIWHHHHLQEWPGYEGNP